MKEKNDQQILSALKEKWKACFQEEKEKWDKNPGWPAKLVQTTFMLNGIKYTIEPPDLGLSYDPWDQGFMEHIQGDIRKDLESIGATDINNFGFLD